METRITEIADGVHQLSTYVADADFTFNQFLVAADEPLLFHTGPRRMFPLVRDAVARILPPESLRWITFGHVEADECGSMNDWLAVAPAATVAHSAVGCLVSVEDLADRPPRPLADGDVLDLGDKRVRHISTPHVPHGWDAGLLFEETTNTLFCGDLFTRLGPGAGISDRDPIDPAMDAEDVFGATALTPATAPTIRSLAGTGPTTLGLMHGPAYAGDTMRSLHDLADAYETRLGLVPA
jgi:flavorubredoxin